MNTEEPKFEYYTHTIGRVTLTDTPGGWMLTLPNRPCTPKRTYPTFYDAVTSRAMGDFIYVYATEEEAQEIVRIALQLEDNMKDAL